ncbi:MAG: DUF2125 domain-containing protein [Ferrovibrio sp.]
MRYLVLIGLIVGGLLGYYVLWSHLADQMTARADAWIEAQRRLGRDVSYSSRRIWGFPYRLSLTLEQPHWSDPRLPMAPRVDAGEITAHLQLWNQEHVIFELSGSQTVAWQENGAVRNVSLKSERFRASLVNDGAGNWLRVAADISMPQLKGPSGGIWHGDWSADKLLLHIRRAENVPPSTDLALQADRAVLPLKPELASYRLLQSLRLTGNLRGSFYGNNWEDILSNWREAGGVVDFSTIAFTWDELKVNGNGSLSIDREFRPLGAMAVKTIGAMTTLDGLQATGAIDPTRIATARRALEATKETVEKGVFIRDVALTAQGGQLSLGDVPVFSLSSVLPGR